jgi:hypothetical protein
VRINAQLQQLLAIGMPLAALLLIILVAYPSWGRLNQFRREVEDRKVELQAVQSAPIPTRDPVLPAANDTPEESSEFIGVITGLVNTSRCEMVGLTTQPAAAANGLVRPKRVQLRIKGHYPAIRALLWRLRNSPRRFTVTELSLQGGGTASAGSQERADTRLTASLTIERYVSQRNPAPSSTPGAASS